MHFFVQNKTIKINLFIGYLTISRPIHAAPSQLRGGDDATLFTLPSLFSCHLHITGCYPTTLVLVISASHVCECSSHSRSRGKTVSTRHTSPALLLFHIDTTHFTLPHSSPLPSLLFSSVIYSLHIKSLPPPRCRSCTCRR